MPEILIGKATCFMYYDLQYLVEYRSNSTFQYPYAKLIETKCRAIQL